MQKSQTRLWLSVYLCITGGCHCTLFSDVRLVWLSCWKRDCRVYVSARSLAHATVIKNEIQEGTLCTCQQMKTMSLNTKSYSFGSILSTCTGIQRATF